jgi:hypothetical protein
MAVFGSWDISANFDANIRCAGIVIHPAEQAQIRILSAKRPALSCMAWLVKTEMFGWLQGLI